MVKDLDIKPVYTTVKNPQGNDLVDQVHQVIYNMFFTKDIDNKEFDCIYPLIKTLSSIAWEIMASYHRTIGAMPGQAVFGREIIFNLTPVVECQVITAKKQ